MPRAITVPAAQLSRHHAQALVVLLDLQTADGTSYYWSNFAGNFPVVIGAGPNANYSPWIASAGPFKRTRSTQSDAGDIVVQNLSGNSIDRDVAAALKAHEFEGALAVLRVWHLLWGAAVDEYHGTLAEQTVGAESATFRLVQLLDCNLFDVPDDVCSEQCTLDYKSPQCGSLSGLADCAKTFSDCQARNAVERFNGVPAPPPGGAYPPPVISTGGLGVGNDQVYDPPGYQKNKDTDSALLMQ